MTSMTSMTSRDRLMAFRARELSGEERQQLLAELDELNRMLPDPDEAEHLRAAVQNVLRRYGQTP